MKETKSAFIPYARPDIGPEEIEAVSHALASGWITTGPETSAFEKEFGEFLGEGCRALAVNSATAGLHLALEAIGIGPGDEVIVPTLTFTATAEVVRYLGADPVFADCNRHTFNIDPDLLPGLITSRTKAIMVVHYGGLACDMDVLLSVARSHGLKVIEDAAHAFPTTYRGQMIGTLESDITVFSFYANKTMTTGEGGMVVSRNEDYVQRMRIMRLHGIDRDTFGRYQSEKPAWYYQVIAPGYKYNMTDIAAALGRVQLKRINSFAKIRSEIAEAYYNGLRDLPLQMPARPLSGDIHAWHIFAVRHVEGERRPEWREQFIKGLLADGVGTSVHYIPLHRQPYWRDRYQLKAADFPSAEAVYSSVVSLPLYTLMTAKDVNYVIESVKRNACI